LQNVDIRAGSVLTDVPPRNYDLIVFSEIGYYFERDVLAQITRALMARLSPGGLLLGAHWLGHSDDHILSGDEVHEVITGLTELEVTFSERHAKYRLEHWKIA
jgi:chemotaxis methyl-accepting protein methylase